VAVAAVIAYDRRGWHALSDVERVPIFAFGSTVYR